jgi:hypothetical protein
MEPVGPPWNTPGVLPDCKPCDPWNVASSSATIVIQEKNGVKLQDSPRATIAQHNRLKIAVTYWGVLSAMAVNDTYRELAGTRERFFRPSKLRDLALASFKDLDWVLSLRVAVSGLFVGWAFQNP